MPLPYYRSRRCFDPNSTQPFKLSRTKIELYAECPRCFYLATRLGIPRPPGYPFSLNAAVDRLLKKEFDLHRAKGTAHPMMSSYGISAVPFADDRLSLWRDPLRGGIQHLDTPTNFLVFGAIDDCWVGADGKLMIVDYKATAKDSQVNLDAEWQNAYKRQMEVYQWLFRNNGFQVSDTGYFVYANGRGDKEAFDGKLEFDVKILPYTGQTHWIEPLLLEARRCITMSSPPSPAPTCPFCTYVSACRL